MNLESIDVAPLDVATALPDLRRDLHVFVDFVRAREVKRCAPGERVEQGRCETTCQALVGPGRGAGSGRGGLFGVDRLRG